MQFKNFTLDPFQEEAVESIEKNHSVVVSAATGTGKTLIADYVIDKHIDTGATIVYTAPIKALSNQKFKDFKKEYGEQNVGILTGDVSINPTAPILIMTTEIYRNMLLSRDNIIFNISYVIFDEIHYMNDPERGTVWEESVIFSPKHIRFICLSATIPNADEFAAWISSIKEHPVDVVRHAERAVPLEHKVYDIELGITDAEKLKENLTIPRFEEVRPKKGRNGRVKKERTPKPDVGEVLSQIEDKMPAIIFSFSRKACEEEAIKLGRKHTYATPQEQEKIIHIYRSYFTPEVNRMQTTAKLRESLGKGIAFHHAGLLPQHKDAVEHLFAEGLIKTLFATETFSVGINMPAKTVVFNGLRKYDGTNFRLINSKEYFQLAGRAGRRGIDTVGYVIAMVDRRDNNFEEFVEVSKEDKDPIRSQFALSINTTLNLVAAYDDAAIETILKSNFDYYIKKKASNRQVRILASFNNKKRVLQRMNYLTKNAELTEKGLFAQHIYFEELLITEIFSTELYKRLNETEILQLIASIIYEQRSNDHFSFRGIGNQYDRLVKKIISNNIFVERKLNKLSLKRMMNLIGNWADGCPFEKLLPLTSLAEGDIIRLFRRIIDMIGQIERATTDPELKEKLSKCQKKIDRDLVAIDF